MRTLSLNDIENHYKKCVRGFLKLPIYKRENIINCYINNTKMTSLSCRREKEKKWSGYRFLSEDSFGVVSSSIGKIEPFGVVQNNNW